MIQIDPENLAIKVQYTIEWADCEELYAAEIESPYYNNPPEVDELTHKQKAEILNCVIKVYLEGHQYSVDEMSVKDLWACRLDGICDWLDRHCVERRENEA